MSKLVLATANEGKVREFQQTLADTSLTLLSAAEAGVTAFPQETGSSYEENALGKAGYVALQTRLPSLGDDSGLEVDALDGAPGLYSARFGGKVSSGERIAYLLAKLRRVPPEARGARFVCVLVLATPNGGMWTFRGESEGRLLEGPRGESGFGYDPVFYSPDLGKTFAEATPEEKRSVSHRGRALEAFRAWLDTPRAAKVFEGGTK